MGTSAAPNATSVEASARDASGAADHQPADGRRQRAGDDEDGERRHLEHDEHVQHAAPRLDAEVVHQRQGGDGRDGQRHWRRIGPARRAAARRWRT